MDCPTCTTPYKLQFTDDAALHIRINLDNDAFHDSLDGRLSAGPELARILREYADRIEYEAHPEGAQLFDINGNHVGHAVFNPGQ